MWCAYCKSDAKEIKKIAGKLRHLNTRIEQVVGAHLDRFPKKEKPGRPERVLLEIQNEGPNSFAKTCQPDRWVFREFSLREGIYGFGYVQVKRLLNSIERRKVD